MALTDVSEQICLVCNSNIDSNSCTNIFYVSLPHSGETLVNFVAKILKLLISDLCSCYICLRCYNLFGMLEQAQWTAANIQCEILKVYQSNSNYDKVTTNSSTENVKINEVIGNSFKTEKLEQINTNVIDITDQLSKRDSNFLNNITNTSVRTTEVDIKNKDELHVINDKMSIPTNFVSIEKCLEKYSNTFNETHKPLVVNLNTDNLIFSDELVKNTVTQVPKEFKCNNAEEQSNSNAQENINVSKIMEITSGNSSNKSWKSGRISKYSQKPLKHTCPTCNKKWRTSTELKTHMKSHSNLRPYMCEICGQSYKYKHALEIHIGMHNGVSPFRCSYCNKCFTQKGALQRHLPMHTGETPYQCELCGKRFVHHTSYNMHALSHTGKKSYACHVCDLSLLSTSHLKRHMRVHTGEKPFSCNFCCKRFAERYNLLAHQKIHDPMQISAKTAKRT